LANLCKLAETRYGYIQTKTKLVVMCFRVRVDHSGTKHCTVKISSIDQ
jgi:hypothetical protein